MSSVKSLALTALLALSGCFSAVPVHVTGAVPDGIEEQLWDAGTIWDLDVYEAGPGAPIRIKYIENYRRDTMSDQYPRGKCGHGSWRLADCSREIEIDPKCDVVTLAHELGHTFGIQHTIDTSRDNVMQSTVHPDRWQTTIAQRDRAETAGAFLATCPM